MSNTVITNYTDLNGPSTKADSSVVVIVNKDGSLSVDQKLLGTLMGTDGSQSAGISVVRVGHEGKPDDATDSESEDDKIPHVTLSVDSYYDEPNSIIKYDSGAEMLQSLRIETRENSLLGFQNDHCYTPLKSPTHDLPQSTDTFTSYDESVIEITHTPPPKPVPSSKKITILEEQIIPKGKKLILKPTEAPVIIKGTDILNKPLPIVKTKELDPQKSDENTESSSISSSGDSIPDRDSDSDYKDTKDRPGSLRLKKTKLKPRILKTVPASRGAKLEPRIISRLKPGRPVTKKENKEKVLQKIAINEKKDDELDLESILPSSKISTTPSDATKSNTKLTPKVLKKEKKAPVQVHSALLSDMTSLFSTPDVIRRVSTDNKPGMKNEKELTPMERKLTSMHKTADVESPKPDLTEKTKNVQKLFTKPREKPVNAPDKTTKAYDPMPHIDDASLAQILQDTTGISSSIKTQPTITTNTAMNSPGGLAGPLSPTLDLLGGLQPEEEGLTEDFLMSVAQLVASSENLQEVIDKQVLGKVDSTPVKTVQPPQQLQTPNLYTQTLAKTVPKVIPVRKDPIEIVRRDGRVITLPPIEAPATRSSKRKSQIESTINTVEVPPPPAPPVVPIVTTPEPQMPIVSKQYTNKKVAAKKQEQVLQTAAIDKVLAESQDSWNSEDDPYRLWCICKQPHNNRFMICCDGCEDWFHGKCVNITKAMGQQMEAQGIEWRCPNCIKKAKPSSKNFNKVMSTQSRVGIEHDLLPDEAMKSPPMQATTSKDSSKTSCIVCKKPARISSIYCSNTCICKHAQDSLGSQALPSRGDDLGRPTEKQKAESRVIVYERKSGRLLAGSNAPTAENLKSWLQSNPTFEVVRPGTLSTIKPSMARKRPGDTTPKVQTTLNFERIPKRSDNFTPKKTENLVRKNDSLLMKRPENVTPRRSIDNATPKAIVSPMEVKEKTTKLIPMPRDEMRASPQLKSPIGTRHQQSLLVDTPKASTSTARPMSEPKKIVRAISRSQSQHDKAPSVSPSPSRRKDSADNRTTKMSSGDYEIRENVRKALQEQISVRMAEPETTGVKFSEDEIEEYANDVENELHELFRDVGMKYKAKYRSLMFNIKDRKNLTLWQKICDRELSPKQLVRMSPEELASQELAQWRDKEAKHQLELIKKSELDLLAASKTYVLKTHKGEEVMENKESVSTELNPELVPVEDVVTALNDETIGPEVLKAEDNAKKEKAEKKHGKKRNREDINSSHSKKSRRESKRESDRKSRSSKRRSEIKESRIEERRSMRRSEKKSRGRDSKEKSEPRDRSRHRSRSKSRRRSKSQGRERSKSRARSKRRSQSRDSGKRRNRSRSRSDQLSSSDDKPKQRSRSQDSVYSKTKNDSQDVDSIERPKSAMQKEIHPEYDPHEPMITSAFSEEDLRKSRDDVYDDGSYNNELKGFDSEYEASKTMVDADIPMPSTPSPVNKVPEVESDQEPSSTVESSAATVWSGCINMVDVARFYVAAHEASGSATDLEEDLSAELDVVGRINPDTVWDYIAKMKKTSNKDIVILRLQTANDEEKMQYIALYSYLSSRNRLGVVKTSHMMTVKDLYIVPLSANAALPSVLLPLDGPGLGENRTHILIAIVIRKKRLALPLHMPVDAVAAKVTRVSRKRSFTPPASPKRRTIIAPAFATQALSTTVKDKIAASLVSADDQEAYSPGGSPSGVGHGDTLRNKMDELNRQIEEQKQQIRKMAQADSSVAEENEAYSPSRPMTPDGAPSLAVSTVTSAPVPLADIALPSNLQEILATIKQRSETANSDRDVDMRNLP